jgi:arylsulfatase A-like enzyme
MAGYYGTNSQIDFQVGRMIALLKRKGLYENTLIVYTSDHGDYMGFHHLMLKGNHLYDPVVKVPLIVRYPGGERAGEVSRVLVSNVDMAPTLLTAAGAEVPDVMTGMDLRVDADERATVFAESEGAGTKGKEYMVRTRSHKLLQCADGGASQFFDLDVDPLEMDDRIDDPRYARQVADLRDSLFRWSLFDSPSRIHLDPGAPVVSGDNRPPDPVESARLTEDYFHRRMSE